MSVRKALVGAALAGLLAGCSSHAVTPTPPAPSVPESPLATSSVPTVAQSTAATAPPSSDNTSGLGEYMGTMAHNGSSLSFVLRFGPPQRGDSLDGCGSAQPKTDAWLPLTLMVNNVGSSTVAPGEASFAFTVTQRSGYAGDVMSVTVAGSNSCADDQALSSDDPLWDVFASESGRFGISNTEELVPGGGFRLQANLVIHHYKQGMESKLFLTLPGSTPGTHGYLMSALTGGPLAYATGLKDLGTMSSLEGLALMVPLDARTSPCSVFKGIHLLLACPASYSWTDPTVN